MFNNKNIHSFDFLNFSNKLGGKIGINLSKESIFGWFQINKNKLGFPWSKDLPSKRLINLLYNYEYINSSSSPRNKKKLDSKRVDTKVWDVRNGLPFKENSFDGCFSHMLYCMALTTKEIINLNKEVKRILKPKGINIFTVRHIGDEDYKNGIHIGEDLYQNDGFIVHFFSKEKIKEISKGFMIESINEFHEGKFPRKLFIATLKKE